MDETGFFRRKRVLWERLLPYGFIKDEGGYRLATDILDGQFRLHVSISNDGRIDTRLIDAAFNEEYVLHRVPGAVGSFAGMVREAYENALIGIASGCFETDVFKSEQARTLISYVRQAYKGELEYLWDKFPDNAIWRRADNNKWYGALLTVARRKLGVDSDELVEIIDLRAEPDEIAKIVDGKSYFPGWHMNKKSWYTVVLDGSVAIEAILRGIDESYLLAAKK